MSTNHRPSYVALVAALRAEFNDLQLEATNIQMLPHRYDSSSLGTLAQAVHDAHDIAYDTDTRYLVWSNEHSSWWRPNHSGYTTFIEEAGRYERGEAERIVSRATLDGRLALPSVNPITGEEYEQLSEHMVLAPEATR